MTATVTNLKTQVQAKIDSATGATSLEDLLILRKAADGLDCNEINLDTLITAKLNAMNSATAPEDLLIGNRAADIQQAATVQTVVKKSQEILVSSNWTSPAKLAGDTVWVTGAAGGGSGCVSGSSGQVNYIAVGGWGGSYAIRYPIKVTPGQVIPVTIGAGGAATSSSTGNLGGDTIVGSYLILKGGKGGASLRNESYLNESYRSIGNGVGVRPYIGIFSSQAEGVVFVLPSESVNGNSCGNGVYNSSNNCAYGGGAGLFGRGGSASNSGDSSATPEANSGAGGGSTRIGIAGAGAAGKLIIEWEEFL
jgi:hypothetical protein